MIWFNILGERTSRIEDTGEKDGKEMEVIPEMAGVIGIKTGRIHLPSGRNGFSLIMEGAVEEALCPCMLFLLFIDRK